MLLLSAVLLGAGAHALKFNGARATPLTFALQDIKARADAPAALPTSPPQANAELVRRAGTTLFFAPDNTCGYLTGDSDIAYTCNNAGAQCAISTPSASTGYIGCCADGDCAGYHVACVDSDAYSSSSACGASCRADILTLKCTASDVPYCNSVSINGGSLKVYGYYCNNEAISTMQALYTTYNGETDGRAFTASVVTASTSATETASFGGGGAPEDTSSVSSGSAAGAPTSTSPSPSSSSSSGSSNGGGKKSNTGAIAGGVVGGVVGLVLIGAAVFFFRRHQHKNDSQQPPQAGAVGGAPAPGAPGAPGAGYGMSQPPPPPGGYYTAEPAPNQPGYYHQQSVVPPQQYYAAAAVPGAVSPDRADSTSPLKPDYTGSGAGSPQLGHDYRMSSVSAVTNTNSQYTGPISPQHTGQTAVASTVSSVPGAPGTPQVPATIHEAAGNAVGTPDYNANHRGEMAELA